MTDERDIGHEIERVAAGLAGLVMLAFMAARLWRWYSGCGWAKTIWGAIAGKPIVSGRGGWDYGFWELCPDGQLAAAAAVALFAALLAGAILDWRRLYVAAAGVVACGYLVNAVLMLKLMAAY